MGLDEEARIEALHDYRVLDTPPEEVFDNITHLTARVLGTPIVLVSLVDAHRQWFKSRVGLPVEETPREHSFCAHAILGDKPMVVEDARTDPRFATNPLVIGPPGIRFYCGVPLRTPGGYGLGTLCIIDGEPRTISETDLGTLAMLARQVEIELEIRRQLAILTEVLENQRQQQPRELLAAMLIHDLRSPLTSLMMLASFVKTEDEESRATLEEMLAEAERMRRMLKDVLDICLYQVGQLKARRKDLMLRPFVEAIVRRLERLGRPRKQPILFELPDSTVSINADPDLLERVLENLVINAIDHGPSQQPISLALVVTAQGRVRGEVRDLGSPILEAARSTLFQLFTSTRSATGRLGGSGHGLGLAFCRLAMEALGGSVDVAQSGADGGNCFYFEFPQLLPPSVPPV